jgi:hypothetical protein
MRRFQPKTSLFGLQPGSISAKDLDPMPRRKLKQEQKVHANWAARRAFMAAENLQKLGKSTDVPAPYLSRGETAWCLGTSIGQVRRFEEAGKLHPVIDPDGVRLYDPHEVAAMARTRGREGRKMSTQAGEVAAAAFALFREGRSLDEVVTSLEREPAEIIELRRYYLEGYHATSKPTPELDLDQTEDPDWESSMIELAGKGRKQP